MTNARNGTYALVSIALASMALALTACPKPKAEAQHERDSPRESNETSANDGGSNDKAHADEPEHAGIAKRVRVPPEVVKDAKIVTAPVTREALAITLTLPGEIVADPDKSARVSSPTAGRIDQVVFREGTVVKKGDVLAIVRVPELGKVRSAQAATAAKAAAARANAGRLEALVEKKLAATQEAVSAKAEADALEAEARALAEQLRAMGTGESGGPQLSLRAPVGGVVITRDAVVGQPIGAEQTIATIADLSEVWFLGRVFEKDLGRVRIGARAEVELNAYPRERFDGAIEYIAKQIDPVARTLTARVRLQNREDLLRIGLFGNARVATGEAQGRPPQLVVPRTAVVEVAGKPVVFVKQADDDYELHDVVIGDSALGKVEILNGLREGEQVVSEGVFTLKSIALRSTIGEEE